MILEVSEGYWGEGWTVSSSREWCVVLTPSGPALCVRLMLDHRVMTAVTRGRGGGALTNRLAETDNNIRCDSCFSSLCLILLTVTKWLRMNDYVGEYTRYLTTL